MLSSLIFAVKHIYQLFQKLSPELEFVPAHFTHPAFCPPGRVPVPLSPPRAVVEPRGGAGSGHVLCDAMVDATARTCNALVGLL